MKKKIFGALLGAPLLIVAAFSFIPNIANANVSQGEPIYVFSEFETQSHTIWVCDGSGTDCMEGDGPRTLMISK
ncbi:hypothetical protein KCTC32516_00403 [Polaribacter huanghezhanensis]|uniref:hypothetical protein n=1 Tax=Polaribacter huanghezhanensis TaxID=1354726 RepID=UPI002648801C|nr:hypothetical protein [Polaribacter huanghezhanensis]WKD85065.1 hypothetical protein KCTC32516_00403 [Polaribacter huanghezhanensis]